VFSRIRAAKASRCSGVAGEADTTVARRADRTSPYSRDELAPVFVAIFVGLGFWWGLPVVPAILLIGLPTRFWVFAGAGRIAAFGVGPLVDNGVALTAIYGVCAVIAISMGLLSLAVARRPLPAAHGDAPVIQSG
jgi:hypothetical protein